MIERIEETLRRLLEDPAPEVRESAAAAMDRLRAKRSAAAYREKLSAASVEDRIRVVYAAEEMGGSEGVSLLLAALANAEAEVRGVAARALESYLTPPVLKAMVAQLPREQGVVLGNLLAALGKSRRKELAPIIGKYLEHPDDEVRAQAVLAFARVADKAGWEKVLPLAGASAETVRAAVAAALGEWSDSGDS